jgi:hypothetical protein
MKAGLNRFTWDMRHPGFTEFPDMILWTSRNRGVVALPGRYQARLTADGKTYTQAFELRTDPRVTVAAGDLQRRFDLATRVSARVSQANDAVLLIRGIKQQSAAAAAKASDPALKQALGAFDAKLNAIEGRIYQVRNRSRQDPLNYPIMLNDKLAGLIGTIESAEGAPTAQTETVFADLSGQLETQLQALEQLLGSELPSLNTRLTAAGLSAIERRPLVPEPPKADEKTKS